MLFLINLDSAIHRREHMGARLALHALDFERIGVDFRRSSREAIDGWVRDFAPSIAFDHDSLSGAEIGCWASHLTAWRRLQGSTQPNAIVLEDDVVLAESFGDAKDCLADDLHGCDVVFLGTSSRNLSTRRSTRIGEFSIRTPVGIVYNTWGYVIARQWVERLFARPATLLSMPIDHFLGGRAQFDRPRLGVLAPPVVDEDPALAAHSQIAPHTFRLDRSQMVEKARRHLLRSRLGDLYGLLHRWL